MQKIFLVLLCGLFCTTKATAQTVTLYGFVKDSLTQLPLAGATLSNSAKAQKVVTDGKGFFRLQVAPDDLLYALATGYRYDTLRYAVLFQDTITIFLPPVNVLETVTIETGYVKYRADSLRRRQEFEEAKARRGTAIDKSNNKKSFGLTFNLDRVFKKKYKANRNEDEIFKSIEQEAYIRFRFPPQTVAFYTGLKGDALLLFMQLYTPSYDWLRTHPAREQLLDYLSEKLKAYRKNPI